MLPAILPVLHMRLERLRTVEQNQTSRQLGETIGYCVPCATVTKMSNEIIDPIIK